MIAKLQNLGPFQFFFTLSCAEKRWLENLAVVLREKFGDLDIQYEYMADNEVMNQQSYDEELTIPEVTLKVGNLTLEEYLEVNDLHINAQEEMNVE